MVGRWLTWQAMQVVPEIVARPCVKYPADQFCVLPQIPVPGPRWQVAQSWPSPCVMPELFVP